MTADRLSALRHSHKPKVPFPGQFDQPLGRGKSTPIILDGKVRFSLFQPEINIDVSGLCMPEDIANGVLVYPVKG